MDFLDMRERGLIKISPLSLTVGWADGWMGGWADGRMKQSKRAGGRAGRQLREGRGGHRSGGHYQAAQLQEMCAFSGAWEQEAQGGTGTSGKGYKKVC